MLTLVVGLLFAAGVVAQVLEYFAPVFPGRDPFISEFDMKRELNVPTWFSALILSAAAAILGAVSYASRVTRRPFARHWAGLAIVFLLLSLEEIIDAKLYLRQLGWLPHLGNLSNTWTGPALIVLVVLAGAYARFLLALDRMVLLLFAVSAGLYVGGELVLDSVTGLLEDRTGKSVFVGLLGTAEETLSLAGLTIFIFALLTHLSIERLAVDIPAAALGTVSLPLRAYRRLPRILLGVVMFLAAASLVVQVAEFVSPVSPLRSRLVQFVDLGQESAVGTWYGSMTLALCALLLGLMATMARRSNGVRGGHWMGLAAIAAFFSMEEVANLEHYIPALLPATGVLKKPETVVEVVFLVLVIIAYRSFPRTLPPELRRPFIAGWLLFVAGLLPLEVGVGLVQEGVGGRNVVVALLETVEETSEMLGIVLIIATTMSLIRLHVSDVRIEVEAGRDAPEPSVRFA